MQKIKLILGRKIHLYNKPQILRIPVTNYAVNLHREVENILRLRKMTIQLAN